MVGLIKKANSAEDWQECHIYHKGKTAVGYGTTSTKALLDAFKHLSIILQLNK